MSKEAATGLGLLIGLAVVGALASPANHVFSAPGVAGAPAAVATVAPAPSPRPAHTLAPAPDPWWTATGTVAHMVLILVIVAAGAALVAGMVVAVLYGLRHTRLALRDGRVPWDPRDAVSVAAHGRFLEVLTVRAANPQMPASLTHYAPHIQVSSSRTDAPGFPQPADAPRARVVNEIDPAAALNAAGPGRILYAYQLETGEPVLDGVLSLGIGGKPGSGKTTTAALVMAQHLELGSEVLMGDPHEGADESMASRIEALGVRTDRLTVAGTTPEIVRLVARAGKVLDDRKAAGRRGVSPGSWVLLAMDEWTSILRGADTPAILRTLEAIAQEGRKYGVGLLLVAQTWTASAIGGSGFRNPLQSAMVHRMRRDEARFLSGRAGDALPETLDLPPGQALALGVGDADMVRVTVPKPVASRRASRLLPGSFPRASVEPPGRSTDAGRTQPDAPADATPDARLCWIVSEFVAGRDMGEIARELAGQGRAGGRRYQDALAEVNAAIRRASLSG